MQYVSTAHHDIEAEHCLQKFALAISYRDTFYLLNMIHSIQVIQFTKPSINVLNHKW